MMSPLYSICAVLVLVGVTHAQFFPIVMDPYEMAQRIQRMAQPQPLYAQGGYGSSSASSSSSSSSSSGSAPIYFGNQGGASSFSSGGYNPGFQGAGFFPTGGYQENFGTYENGGSLGIRFGQVPGGQGVHVSSSSHSNQPGSSGSFVSSSSATDSDGKVHYNVQSGRY